MTLRLRDVLQPYKLEGYAAYLDHRSFWTDVGVAMVLPRTTPPPTMYDLTRQSSSQPWRLVQSVTLGPAATTRGVGDDHDVESPR